MDEEMSRKISMLDIGDESSLDQHSHHDHDDAHQQSLENCNLIVNYLPHDIDDLALKGLFVEFGEIVSTKVVTDRSTKKSLGYGFVKFVREDDAKVAIQRLNGFTVDNKCLKVSVARPASLEIKNCKLYVTNLPKDYSESEVINLFKEFGEIIECRVLKDRNSRSNKGVAFVQFDNKTQSNNALSLNGCQLEGGSRGLVVKYAEDQHKKREMNRLQNLTSHNVYRYMPPGPGGSSGSGDNMDGPRIGREKSDSLNSAYFYPSSQSGSVGSSPQVQPAMHMQSPQMSHTASPHMQHGPPHQQSPHQHPLVPHQQPSPLQHQHQLHQQQPHQQSHHGLGGINTVFGGASPLQMSMLPQPGGGMASPIMGSVSPNHFFFQQQQLLQQQAMGATSPRMFVYSPTAGMRRALKGRGAGGKGQYPTLDIQQLTADPPQQAYGNWYSPSGQSLSFLAGGAGSPMNMHAPLPGQRGGQMESTGGFGGGGGGGMGSAAHGALPMMQHTQGAHGGSGLYPQQSHQHHQQQSPPQGYQQQHAHQMSPPGPPSHGQSPSQSQPQGQNPPAGSYAQHPQQGQLQPSRPSASQGQGQGLYGQQQHQQQHLPSGYGASYPPPPHHLQQQHHQQHYNHQQQGGGGGASGSGSVTLNVSNLPPTTDVAMLQALFAPFGRILSAQIDVDTAASSAHQQGRVSVCSGRGRVQVAGLAQAEVAVQAVHGSCFLSEVPIQVSIAGSN